MRVDHLYYDGLGDQEKAAYDILVRGFSTRQSIVNVPYKRDADLNSLFRAIKYEHPEFYYVDLYATVVYRNSLFEEYHLVYRYSEEETREKDRKIEIVYYDVRLLRQCPEYVLIVLFLGSAVICKYRKAVFNKSCRNIILSG